MIFTNNITRFNKSIESKSKNLERNILLNSNKEDGVLILKLLNNVDEAIYITLIISKDYSKIELDKSFSFYTTQESLETEDEIDSYLGNLRQGANSLSSILSLPNSIEKFNVYYYVSQAESTHFLKQSINNRTDSLDALLETQNLDCLYDFIKEKLIGGNRKKSGVIINDEMSLTDGKINEVFEKIKKTSQEGKSQIIEYFPLLKYINTQKLEWDQETINFGTENIDKNYNRMQNEIWRLHYLKSNLSDYSVFVKNQDIKKINTSTNIENYISFSKYLDIEKNLIDKN